MNRLKMRVIIWWLRVTRKLRSRGHLLAFKKSGSGVRSALIILPKGRENARIAMYFLKSLPENNGVKLNFLMDSTLYHFFNGALPQNVFIYSVDDINWFQLPKKELVERVFAQSYDAVVDMHPSFNLATAYLTYMSNAPFRIGFSGEFSELFFNIEIDRKSSEFVEKGYQWIQKLLNL